MSNSTPGPTTEPHEIEAKFEIEPADRAALLHAGAFGAFRVVARVERRQDDLYFDTPDLDLRRARSTLRVRRLPDGALLTFKGAKQRLAEAHIASRLEDEVEAPAAWAARVRVDAPLPDGFEAGPLRRAEELAGPGRFVPLARLENERVALRLDDGEHAVELAVDRCRGTRLADGRTVAFDEVEVEVKRGGEDGLNAALEALRGAAPGLRPSDKSKLGRTLAEDDAPCE